MASKLASSFVALSPRSAGYRSSSISTRKSQTPSHPAVAEVLTTCPAPYMNSGVRGVVMGAGNAGMRGIGSTDSGTETNGCDKIVWHVTATLNARRSLSCFVLNFSSRIDIGPSQH